MLDCLINHMVLTPSPTYTFMITVSSICLINQNGVDTFPYLCLHDHCVIYFETISHLSAMVVSQVQNTLAKAKVR